MRVTMPAVLLLLASVLFIAPASRAAAAPASPAASPQKKEYLTELEADKIRDAGTNGPRIVLYAAFAGDRIKKLQYEFAHLDPNDNKRTELLNNLINSYSGCIDDAANLVDIAAEKQEDIRDGIKALQARIKESLPYLKQLAANGPERDTYKDNLDDAIEASQDALADIEKSSKEIAPPPVRRKPS